MEIIAEVGQAHDGSLGILHSFIDAVALTGVDTIKFQTHIAEAESSKYENFRVKFSYVDATRYDYWKRMELTTGQWKELKQHCEAVGLNFLSSPFSIAAVDLLEEIGVKAYKVSSGDVDNLLLLERIGKTGKPVILSSGMSSYKEIEAAVQHLTNYDIDVSILQCTTQYPTSPESIGLNVITELKEKFNLPVGLSDHSGSIYASIAATALGAEIIEVHVAFDKLMFGPDSKSSLTISELTDLVVGVKSIKTALKNPVDKNDLSRFIHLRSTFGKALAVNKDLQAGDVIQQEDLETKKPLSAGIPASEFEKVIGKKINLNLSKYEFIKEDHFD